MTPIYQYLVKGLSCKHCVNAVTNALSELTEVDSVEVDLSTSEVMVVYNSSNPDEEKIKKTLEETGYPVVRKLQ